MILDLNIDSLLLLTNTCFKAVSLIIFFDSGSGKEYKTVEERRFKRK